MSNPIESTHPTPLKTARLMRGLSQKDLAERMGILPQALFAYESGARSLGPKLLPLAAEALNVTPAWLSGMPVSIPVVDFDAHETILCPVIAQTEIPAYGILYLVDTDVGPVSVILASGVQFTLSDWQGEQVMTADEIAQGHWVDSRGTDAIMLGSLPRVLA